MGLSNCEVGTVSRRSVHVAFFAVYCAVLFMDNLFSSHPCPVRTEDVSFHTVSFWLVWKLFLCFPPHSPNHSVFSMLSKPLSSYSCKTYLSVHKILKQPRVLHIDFNLPTEITHPVASCMLLVFPLAYCFVKLHRYIPIGDSFISSLRQELQHLCMSHLC